MKRRAFISMMSGAVGALILPVWRKPDPTIILPAEDPIALALSYKVTNGVIVDDLYSLAPIKAEGSSILYDAVMTEALWPGLEKYWREHYENTPDFEDLFK